MQVLPCHHTSLALVSCIGTGCISLSLVVSRCISLYLVVSRFISLYVVFSLCLVASRAFVCRALSGGELGDSCRALCSGKRHHACCLHTCSSFHASASMPPHISCRCISLYRGGLYLVVSLCSCISIYPSEHLALSCSARTGALNLSAHHGHITGSITGVAHGSHTSLIPDVVVGFVGSPS